MPNWVKKCISCLLLIVLIYLVCAVVKTYGLFEDNLNKEVQAHAASFVLSINSSHISGENTTFTINDVISNNSHVRNTKIAPGTSGYFDIVLDPSDLDVAIRYDITYDFTNMTNSKITMNNISNYTKGTALTRTAKNTYSGIIDINDVVNNVSNTIRSTLTWENDETNNDIDSGMMTQKNLKIPVTIKITQYTGEELETYQGE